MPQVQERTAPNDVRTVMQELRESGKLQGSKESGNAREELRQTFRELSKRNLYFLAKAVLGYSDLTKKTHKPYADFIQDLSNKRTLDLMPRGVYKTTIGTISFAIWYLLNFPNHFILIANQTANNADRMLMEIEGHLDGSNPMMNWLFPDYIKPHAKFKPWSSTQMTVPCRTVISGTPSILALGIGAKTESWHFHVVINDDLIGENAMYSSSEMANAIAWHDYSVSLFVSPREGIERVHGTRWSMSDLYSVILERPLYATYIKSARDRNTGELLFPELLDEEVLREIRDNNFQHYMSQYMNDPQNPEALDFRITWLNRYKMYKDEEKGAYCEFEGDKFYVKDMEVGLFVDPAGSGDVAVDIQKQLKRGRNKRANNAVGVWGLHGTGGYFLLDLWAGRGQGENPELQVAKKMLEMVLRWKGYIRSGYVENYGAQQALITIFNMLCQQEGVAFTLKGIGRSMQKAKIVRIRGALGGPGQNGQIFVRPFHDQFITEFSNFPQSDTFDTLDMSTWAFIQLRKPHSPAQENVNREHAKRRKLKRLRSISKAGY